MNLRALSAAVAFSALATMPPIANTQTLPPMFGNLPENTWYKQNGFLPARVDVSKITIRTENKGKNPYDTSRTICHLSNGLTVPFGSGVVLDNSTLYAMVADKNLDCALAPILSITPKNPNNAQELVAHAGAILPNAGLALKGIHAMPFGGALPLEARRNVGVIMPKEVTLVLAAMRAAQEKFGIPQPSPQEAPTANPCGMGGEDRDEDGIPDALETRGMLDLDGKTRVTSDPQKQDTDGDGLLDGEETGKPLSYHEALAAAKERKINPATLKASECYFNLSSDPRQVDTDGDFLTDAEELDEATDARNSDSDGDGINDGGEVKLWGTDPTLPDSDGDGMSDGEEVDRLKYGFNPLRFDTRMSDAQYSAEFSKGFVCGDACNLTTLPALTGAIAGSVLPVVGNAADARDAVANLIKGQYVSAAFSAVGLMPVSGDMARALQHITQFAQQNPNQLSNIYAVVSRLTPLATVAQQSTDPTFAFNQGFMRVGYQRVKLSSGVDNLASATLKALEPAVYDTLTKRHGLSPEDIQRFMQNGRMSLKGLAETLDSCGNCITRDVATTANRGWMQHYSEPEKMMQAQGKKANALPRPPRERTDTRFYDALVQNTGIEVKTGYVSGSKRILRQIEKDCKMMGYKTELPNGVEWHFFASGRSNSIGAAASVIAALNNCKPKAIPFTFHMP